MACRHGEPLGACRRWTGSHGYAAPERLPPDADADDPGVFAAQFDQGPLPSATARTTRIGYVTTCAFAPLPSSVPGPIASWSSRRWTCTWSSGRTPKNCGAWCGTCCRRAARQGRGPRPRDAQPPWARYRVRGQSRLVPVLSRANARRREGGGRTARAGDDARRRGHALLRWERPRWAARLRSHARRPAGPGGGRPGHRHARELGGSSREHAQLVAAVRSDCRRLQDTRLERSPPRATPATYVTLPPTSPAPWRAGWDDGSEVRSST